MIEDQSGPPSKAEERQLGWQCCTESTTTSLPPMEFRTSSNYHHHHHPPTSTTKAQPAVLAAVLQNPVPAVLIPAENHQRLEWPAQEVTEAKAIDTLFCVKSLQTAVIQNNIYCFVFWCFFALLTLCKVTNTMTAVASQEEEETKDQSINQVACTDINKDDSLNVCRPLVFSSSASLSTVRHCYI